MHHYRSSDDNQRRDRKKGETKKEREKGEKKEQSKLSVEYPI